MKRASVFSIVAVCGLFAAGCTKSCSERLDRATAARAEMPACTRTSTAAFTELADRQWEFLPLEGVRCGRSQNFGVGINKSTSTKRLLLFFLGGGACFDATSCDRACKMKTQLCAANLDGFGPEQWARENRSPERTIFDRADPANPFREDSWAFVPYCTGDFQSGSRRADYGIDHYGHEVVAAALKRIAPTFCDVEQVVLYGVSAGGFAVMFNYEQIRAAFPKTVRIDVVNDSGPTFSRAWMPLQEEMMRSWGSAKHAPADCPGCAENWEKYLPHLAQKYPDARFSLVSFADDNVIARGFGGPFADPTAFRRAITAYAKDVVAPLPNARVFLVPRTGHGLGKEPLSETTALGVSLADFLARQVSGDPAWASAY